MNALCDVCGKDIPDVSAKGIVRYSILGLVRRRLVRTIWFLCSDSCYEQFRKQPLGSLALDARAEPAIRDRSAP